MTSAIVAEGVSKAFGDVEALKSLELDIPEGAFFVLLGPSGAGKTTTLRVIAGLEKPDTGKVLLNGIDATKATPAERDLAMVFQSYALYPKQSAAQNIASPLRARRLSKADIDERVKRVAELLHIEELLNRSPAQMSGGQMQRVALGRALVRDPQVFLMDEPLSNLDAKLRVQTRGEIKRLQKEIGTTTVYVTHDQVEAMTMGDRIAVMNQGRLEQVGTPEELYERPGNRFVAGFIGSPGMSFTRAEAQRDGDGVRLRGDGLDLRLPGGAELPPEVLVGVRPEHARPWREDGELLGPIEGRVAYVEALGRETFLGVDAGRGTRYVVEVEGRAEEQPGDPIRFGLVPAGLRFFDAEGGHALDGVSLTRSVTP
jgi:multiple sugar transport system ATP-binding protein